MKTQKAKTPAISNCFCGAAARTYESDAFDFTYRVECSNGHHLTAFCKYHRAVCRWNNRVTARSAGESNERDI